MSAPKGGRGAMLAKLLAEQQVQPGATSTPESAAQAQPLPRGRAALILGRQKLVEESAASAGPSGAPPLSGRGRALHLALASAQSSTAVNPDAVMPPTEELAKLTVAEEDPGAAVIMRGTMGRGLRATANYVRLNMDPGKGIFEHEVRFEPPVDSNNMRFKYVNVQFGRRKAFDGVVLYLPEMLPNKVSTYPVDGIDGEKYTMTVIYKRQKRLADCMHIYNVCFKRILGILDFAQLGRSYYNPHATQSIPQHRLEIWPGYVTAVDEYEGGIMLCCDSSHRVLRSVTVLDILRDISTKYPRDYKENFLKEVIGQSVLTRYNNKLYTVDDVTWKQSPLTTFTVSRKGVDSEVSYKEYYKNQYSLDIRDDQQPMLISQYKRKVHGTNKKEEHLIALIPELCYMTGLTDAMRADFKVMKDIAQYTRISPNQRQAGLKKFIQNVTENPEACEVLAAWGLTMDPDTTQVEARVADAETIFFGRGATVPGSNEADWNNALGRQSVMKAIDLDQWCLVHTGRNKREAEELINNMTKLCPQMGIQIKRPQVKEIQNDSIDTFLRALKEAIVPSLQIVVIICPTARDDRYAAIKKLCCADQPIPSQVINARTLSRPEKNRSIVQKIALQMNCKLGGTLWGVKIPFNNVMVIGFDTYHDASSRGASVGGFVASLNPELTQWYSRVCIQEPRQELVDNLKVCFTAAVQRYHEINHTYPGRIIIYRDGLGDGQLAMSRDFEVPQLQSCFPIIAAGFDPKLTMIICQKRINTRIFEVLGNNGHSNLGNPPPGTIVDNTVNRRNWYDFFLVSQHVRQGTVTPTHYVVVYDDCQMKVDHVQKLTFKLCHLYYNWPGTIRVPAPVQYAHKLAQLVGQCVKRAPSLTLSDKLYFL